MRHYGARRTARRPRGPRKWSSGTPIGTASRSTARRTEQRIKDEVHVRAIPAHQIARAPRRFMDHRIDSDDSMTKLHKRRRRTKARRRRRRRRGNAQSRRGPSDQLAGTGQEDARARPRNHSYSLGVDLELLPEEHQRSRRHHHSIRQAHNLTLQEIIDTVAPIIEAAEGTRQGITIWTRLGHRIDVAPRYNGCFQTATAIHRSIVQGVRDVRHEARLTTAILQLRETNNHSLVGCQNMNVRMQSAIGHSSNEVNDTCQRMGTYVRRCLKVLMGDFNHLLYEPLAVATTTQTASQPVGTQAGGTTCGSMTCRSRRRTPAIFCTPCHATRPASRTAW